MFLTYLIDQNNHSNLKMIGLLVTGLVVPSSNFLMIKVLGQDGSWKPKVLQGTLDDTLSTKSNQNNSEMIEL